MTDVDVSHMTSFPFSKYAEPEAAYEATQEYLEILRAGTGQEYLTWLRTWLKDELGYRERDFVVDWTTLTLVGKQAPDAVRAALTPDETV